MSDVLLRRLNDRKAKILVVDDEIINAEILASGLESKYDVKIATSGIEALSLAYSYVPDLVLLDIMMPDVDGFAVLQKLKSKPETADIPVIFVTGEDSEQEEIRGLELGANDYVRKPYNMALVSARVDIQIELKQKTDLLNLLANADGLTGLANRRQFDERLAKMIAEARREHMPLGMLLLDIDFFKQYNDNYGHAAGDNCLVQVANALNDTLKRSTDVAARVGGEEFALLVQNVTRDQLLQLSERVHEQIEKLQIVHEGSKVSDILTVSVGGKSLVPQAQTNLQLLYTEVDDLLYKAKSAGRNQSIID